MNNLIRLRSIAARSALLSGVSLILAPALHAQDATAPGEAEEGSTIIVTGTANRTMTDRNSPIPIDLVSGEALSRNGDVDLRSSIERLVPSLAHQSAPPVGSGFKENFTLHGLSTNHLLVMVNGKRRHSSANIATVVGPQQGSTGVDISLIPASAIKRIEVLRDGDSSHYGADALAGVLNVILKDDAEGGVLQASVGQYYKGDGLSRNFAGNIGFHLGEHGFINLSGEYAGRDLTTRVYLASQPPQRNPNQPATDKATVLLNAGYDFGNVELFALGSYGHRTGEVLLTARAPTSAPAVHPYGYEPTENIIEDDYSGTIGLRVEDLAGWSAELATTYGGNNSRFDIRHSANVGLIAATGSSPTTFRVYSAKGDQWSTTLGLSRPFDVGFLAAPLSVSVGGEFRKEYYTIGAGNAASYFSSGSQGVPGLAPQNQISVDRNVAGGYLDLTTKLTPKWLVSVSGRYERYSDTGDTTVGRFTTRYDFSDAIAIRGTIGTGFSAPSLAQQHFLNVSTGPAAATGFLSPNSAAGRSLGAVPLRPERSTNYNLGLVLRPARNLDITIDAYQIDIEDRIIPGGTASGQAAISALALAGFQLLPTIPASAVSASYLTNGADTRTRGLDIAANYRLALGNLGRVDWTLSANVNRTTLTGLARRADGTPALNIQRQTWLTGTTPRFKIIAGAEWTRSKFSLSLRENIFGPTTNEATYYAGPNDRSVTVFEHFRQGTKVTTDVSVSYRPLEGTTLSVGANNLFDVYPDHLPLLNRLQGSPFDIYASQVGFFGGYYYASVRHAF